MKRLVVELTRTSLRVLLLEGAPTQPRIRAFLMQPLAGQPTAATLRQTLSGLPLAGAQVIGVLPREQAITRLLKLPTTKPDELAQMVALSGKAQLPYPAEQAMTDFHLIDQQAGMSVVQLVACHRDQLDRFLTWLRQAGLEPTLIAPSSWGILGWYKRLGRSADVREPALIVHVDADRTDLAVIRQGQLVFSRSLSQGAEAWRQDPEALGTLTQELERSLASLRKELPGMEVQSLMLTGLGPLMQWKETLEQRLTKPVTVKPAQGSLRFPEPPTPGASPAVAVGMAMAEWQTLVNLLPTEVRQAQRQRSRLREFAVTGALILVALMLGAGWLSASVSVQTRVNQATIHAVRELGVVTQQTEQQEQDITLIQQIMEARRWTALALAELFRLTGPEIVFESLVFDGGRGELVVRGSAPGTRQVLDYLRQLKTSDHWGKVELRYSARRGTASSARTDFELVIFRERPHGTSAAAPRT